MTSRSRSTTTFVSAPFASDDPSNSSDSITIEQFAKNCREGLEAVSLVRPDLANPATKEIEPHAVNSADKLQKSCIILPPTNNGYRICLSADGDDWGRIIIRIEVYVEYQ